ncbi:hypothetical protein HB825_00480 [Listeria booriae]|uniref:hypothetical protein n=1 Tax=Listeria booriae TaxID=1552123 RepID=UPI00164EB662|nr:hypothetical protein [Listeria booriae]MBC6133307.1 hypothetical protein [Listeria booriae]
MGKTTHDFSQASIDKLNSIVKDEEKEGGWDWWDDHFIDIPEIGESKDSLEKYHREVIDKHDIGQTEFDNILKNIENIDHEYEEEFTGVLNQLESFRYRLNNIGQIITPSVISASTDTISAIISYANNYELSIVEYGDYMSEHPERLKKINEYEALHPESAKKVDDFLSSLPLQDRLGIKYLIYTAEEPYRSLCLKYMDKFKITSTIESGVFTHESGAFFWHKDATLVFDIDEDRINSRGQYYTFFHEMGHAIDYYYGKENGADDFYSSVFKTNGKTLSDYNIQDVENNVRQSLGDLLKSEEYKGLSASEKQKMLDNISQNILKQDENYDNLSAKEQELQDTLEIDYTFKLSGPDNESASDVYQGVTNFTIDSRDYGYGHSDGYWFDKNGNNTNKTNKESFAEFFGRKMTVGDTSIDGLESIETYLPESKEHMEKMLESMG